MWRKNAREVGAGGEYELSVYARIDVVSLGRTLGPRVPKSALSFRFVCSGAIRVRGGRGQWKARP